MSYAARAELAQSWIGPQRLEHPVTAPKKRERPLVAGGYRAPLAQQRATALSSTARCPSRLKLDGSLWGHVERLLRKHHSPEQIAGILQRMHPDQPTPQVNQETIYTALYAIPGEDRRGSIPDMISIHQRPPEIDEHVIPRHWEDNLIKGARNTSLIGTLVERTTLFVTLVKMTNATADTTVTACG